MESQFKYIYFLILAGLLIYSFSFFNGFVWDDPLQILNNQLVHSPINIFSFFSQKMGFYYKPLMLTVFSFIYAGFGPNAFLFHVFQVFIHILNCLLVFGIFKTFFKKKISFVLALIFLVHPINVEAAVYIAALQDTLYLFFGLLALWITLKRLSEKHSSIKPSLAITSLLLLSLLSKEAGVLFVVELPVFVLLWRRQFFLSYFLSSSIALFIYCILRFVIAKVGFIKNELIPIFNASFYERLLSIPQIIYYYLKTFFFPKDLAIDQNWVVKTVSWPEFYFPLIISSLFFIILVCLAVFLWRRKSRLLTIYIIFTLWLILGIAPYLQIIPLDMTVADRWFYFPIIGILGIFGVILESIQLKNLRLNLLVVVFASILIIALSVRTIIRTQDWFDAYSLYSKDIKISTNSYSLHNNLGVELDNRGKIDEAHDHFKKALEIVPQSWDAWNNLGVTYLQKKEFKKAQDSFEKSIEIDKTYYVAYTNLGRTMLFYDTPANTRTFLLETLKRFPDDPVFLQILSITEYRLGNKAAAKETAEKAYKLRSDELSNYIKSTISENGTLDPQKVLQYYNP